MAKTPRKPTKKSKTKATRPLGYNPKAEQRILRFINRARTPRELSLLPQNRLDEPRDLGPGGISIHDEPEVTYHKILDEKNARRLLEARHRESPLWGFWHFDQVKRVLEPAILKDFSRKLFFHMSSATYGQWIPGGTVTVGGATMVARHAALLRTGNVLLIEGACSGSVSRTWIWNPTTRSMLTPAPANPGDNLYCAGHSFLSDGRLLVAGGGGELYQNQKDRLWLFDPIAGSWDYTRNPATNAQTMMAYQRWYPTCVTLGDDRVLIASGDQANLTCGALTLPAMPMEIYNEATGQISPVSTPADKYFPPTYPGLHLIPPHSVFFAPVGFRNNSELPGACGANEPSSLLTFSGMLNGSWGDLGAQDRTKGMSVLLIRQSPPYIQVMVIGGGDATKAATYTKIDLSVPNPSWGPDFSLPQTAAQAQPTQRTHPNLVLLADGTLFLCGGADVSEPCWLYDPETLSWAEMDQMNYARRYHSVALLLPTGEVMATGGQGTVGDSEIEVFQPPYLFNGARPTITAVTPSPIHHGNPFIIQTPDASDILKVMLLRPMAVTHQTDSEQRAISLAFAATGSATLSATAPSPAHPHGLAPKGYYMLFLINNAGVPSEATFVFLH